MDSTKTCRYGGRGCRKFRKIADVVYEWSLGYYTLFLYRIGQEEHGRLEYAMRMLRTHPRVGGNTIVRNYYKMVRKMFFSISSIL